MSTKVQGSKPSDFAAAISSSVRIVPHSKVVHPQVESSNASVSDAYHVKPTSALKELLGDATCVPSFACFDYSKLKIGNVMRWGALMEKVECFEELLEIIHKKNQDHERKKRVGLFLKLGRKLDKLAKEIYHQIISMAKS